MKELLNMNVDEMAGISIECSCGHVHKVEIKNIKIGSGAVRELNNILSQSKGRQVFIVEDINTYEAAGRTVENNLRKNFKLKRYIFNEDHLVPDEKALGRLLIEMPQDTAVILGIGSGTINDICRFLSCRVHIPYIIVCTAPSMDGYASVVSPLIVNGVKTTYNAVYPDVIIADIDIMKEAPLNMLHAGLGDILGKYTALADWHISEILNGEYFCSTIEDLTLKAVDKCIKTSTNISIRDQRAVETITEALILSGLAIGMTGTSRPASGEEHHLSHCWDTIFMNEGRTAKWLHGNNVGVGVGIIIEAYKYTGRLDIQKIYNSGEYAYFDRNRWINNLSKVYGRCTNDIVKFKEDSISFNRKDREAKMKNILEKWEDIKKICNSFLPEAEEVRCTLRKAGAVYSPKDLGIDRELFKKSFVAAKDIRSRYGILQLLEDIGKLEEAAEAIANIYYS